MAKFAFALCLLLVAASAPYSQAGLFDPIEDQITEAINAVDKVIQRGLDQLKETSAEIDKRVQELLDALKEDSNRHLEGLNAKINETLDKLNEKIDEIVSELKGDDASECKTIGEELRETALSIIANSSNCLASKINEATGYVHEISHLTSQAAAELDKISRNAKECAKNADGILAGPKAILCLQRAHKSATIAVTKRIPAILHEASLLAHEVKLLGPSLAICTASSSVTILLEESDKIIVNVKNCVDEKLNANNPSSTSADDLTTDATDLTTDANDLTTTLDIDYS